MGAYLMHVESDDTGRILVADNCDETKALEYAGLHWAGIREALAYAFMAGVEYGRAAPSKDWAWWTWHSPNGVEHLVPGNRPCATCGMSHVDGPYTGWQTNGPYGAIVLQP
jgi:hypothetical protein